MAAFMLIINIVVILVALVLIVSVLMQEGNRAGLGAIGGGAETFFGKSKAKGIEGKLERITKIAAGLFTVLVILLTSLYTRYGSTTSTVTTPAETVAEATVAPEDADVTPVPSEAASAADVTAAPTVETEATAEPTVAATEAATAAPTAEPTVAPTEAATVAPSATPAA